MKKQKYAIRLLRPGKSLVFSEDTYLDKKEGVDYPKKSGSRIEADRFER